MRTAFNLPFELLYPAERPAFAGTAWTLSVKLRTAAPDEARREIASAVRVFTRIVDCGALGGASIRPEQSFVGTVVERLSESSDEVHFEFTDCRVDTNAIVVLADLLLHAHRAPYIAAVSIDGGSRFERLSNGPGAASTYPERFPLLPFQVVDCQPESGAYTLLIELATALGNDSEAYLQQALAAWRDCVLAGAFALAPIPPENNYLEPDDPFIEYDNVVEWTVFKLRAHPASLDALINLVGAFSARCQRVTRLTLQ